MLHKTTRTHARTLLALSLAAILAGLSAAPALAGSCTSPSFTQQPIYAVGNDPRSMAVADFDGDGRPDVVVANYGSDSVTVLTKVGRGLPATANSYAVGHGPHAVAAADFNGDGRADIVTADNSAGTVTVLLNDGAGGFGGPPATFAVGGSPRSIAVGDFNGDGKLDLAVACESSGITILLGNGQGGFGAPSFFQAGQQPHFVTAADINGDGKLDLAVATVNLAQVFFGDGKGGFSLAANQQCVPQRANDGIAIGDLNGDGKPDMVAADLLAAQIHVMLGDGSGCFGASTNISISDPFNSSDGRPKYVMLADLNGDGKLDIVAENVVALGDGTGKFGTPKIYGGAGGGDYAPGIVADFDGDGKLDLVRTNGSGTFGTLPGGVNILFGDGAGGFKFVVGDEGHGAGAVARADFNGDGKPDLAVSVLGSVVIMLGDGAGGFGPPVKFNSAPGAGSVGIVVADFNRDSKPDVAVLDSSNGEGGFQHVLVLPGDGAGGLGSPIATRVGNFLQPWTLAGGDFNGDGKPDLIVLNRGGGPNNGGSISILLGDGAGGFSVTPNVGVGTAVNAGSVGVADFNGDGKLDLAVPGFSNPFNPGFSIMLGDGAGGFGPPTGFISANAQSVAVADLNGDGKLDLALVSPDTAKVSVVLGDGTGNFGLATKFDVASNPQDVIAADFNGDGKADVAVASLGASSSPFSTVSVLFGDGAGGFGPAANYAVAKSPNRIAAGDFNGDGLLDIVTSNAPADNVSVLLNTCGASSGDSPAVQFSAPSYTVGEGDGSVTVTVTRTGSLAGAASVRYATSDGTASERSDYIAAYGTLRFASGESAKSFKVLVIDDARAVEGSESFNLTLSDAAGATLGATSFATVTILNNDPTVTNVNPIDDASFFVREHYYDFLNREPDASGFQFWTNNITSCGSDTNCVAVKRVNVSAAFFLSIEFQETGYLVERTYKTAFGDTTSPNVPGTVPIIRLKEFLADTQEIGQGVVVGQGNWQQQLEDNKNAFALEFVQRPRFTTAFPSSLTADQFVSRLNTNAGGVLADADKSQLEDVFGGPSATSADASKRAQVLRAVAENAGLRQAEFNRAFVLMQYFGYLRRNPDDAPDGDFRGWKFWLDKLNQFNGNYVQAEMVKAFLSSAEYRLRFNSPNGF